MTAAMETPRLLARQPGRLMLVMTYLSPAGGAETQVVDLARGFDRRGWDVHLVSMLVPAPPLPDLTGTRIRVTSLEMRRGVASPAALARFVAMVRRERPDVVHSHMTHANLLVRAARPLMGVPVLVNTLHGHKMYSVHSGGSAFRELAHRFTDFLADATTAVSQAAADRYAQVKAVSPRRLVMIPNGIPWRAYERDDRARKRLRGLLEARENFVWLAVGRMEKVKDYATMLRAFAIAHQAEARQTLVIAGDGSERAVLETLAGQLGIAARIRFLGVRHDVTALLQAADGFVLSSIFEGMPLVLLEAGASSLPMVATRVGGNAEVLPPEQRDWLVPPQNPRALAEAMLRILTMTDAQRRATGSAARGFVFAHYRMDSVLDRWEELYARLLAKKGAAQVAAGGAR
jgi:glycosyltransferase involved in cell wall biosynthesis